MLQGPPWREGLEQEGGAKTAGGGRDLGSHQTPTAPSAAPSAASSLQRCIRGRQHTVLPHLKENSANPGKSEGLLQDSLCLHSHVTRLSTQLTCTVTSLKHYGVLLSVIIFALSLYSTSMQKPGLLWQA